MLLGVYFGVGTSTPTSSTRSSACRSSTRRSTISAPISAGSASSRTPRLATLIFGFFHGFGLATKILEYDIAPDGLLPNLLAFNVGVEIGQLLALAAILIVMGYWRRTRELLATRLHRQRRS